MHQATDTDEELVARFRASGDARLAEQLVRRHTPRIRKMMYAMVLSHADADDLTQEAFLRAFRGLGTFRGEARFSTWLYRIALNTARSHLRKGRADPSPASGAPCDPEDPAASPVGRLLDLELHEQVSKAMALLSPELRAALVLTRINGLKPAEAAELENCSVVTIYWRVHKARRQLARDLQGYLKP